MRTTNAPARSSRIPSISTAWSRRTCATGPTGILRSTASPQKPSVIYYGTDKVLRTKDRGATFEEISPDLTKNEKDKQGLNGGPITVENVGAEFYGTILTITASPHEYGTVWVGSDDGLVHVTRDDGETWQNVTPGNLRGAMVNAIDVSPHDPGTAYVAVAGYKLNDFRPYIYKLTDYGRRRRSGSIAICPRTISSASCAKTRNARACFTRAARAACTCHSTTVHTGRLWIPACPRCPSRI